MTGSNGNGHHEDDMLLRALLEGDERDAGWVLYLPARNVPARKKGNRAAGGRARPRRGQIVDVLLTLAVILYSMLLGAVALAAWLGMVTIGPAG